MDHPFSLRVDGLSADALDDQEKEPAAIKPRDRQQIEYADIDRDKRHQRQRVEEPAGCGRLCNHAHRADWAGQIAQAETPCYKVKQAQPHEPCHGGRFQERCFQHVPKGFILTDDNKIKGDDRLTVHLARVEFHIF